MKGTVKYINQERKYGFIKDERFKEYFFHKEDCVPVHDFENMERGMEVEFLEDHESKKGPRAQQVTRL